MRQVEIPRFGGPEVLRLVERPSPPLVPGSVRITVSAAGVNFADLQMRMGLYPEAPRTPFVPGYEVAGVVSEVAPGVEGFRVGARVLALCLFGGYTDEIVVPTHHVRPTPRRMTDLEAAAVPVPFATAWVALHEMARVREGDRVLVTSAAGGVGGAMVQLAARAGARVTGAVSSAAKKEVVRSLGAAEALTYDELAAGRGGRGAFTLACDSRGGAALGDTVRRLAPGGRVVSFGFSSMIGGARRSIPRVLGTILRAPLITPIGLAMGNYGIFGLNMLKLVASPEGIEAFGRAIDGVLAGFADGSLSVTVSRSYPLALAGKAHAHLQDRRNSGSVVLSCT